MLSKLLIGKDKDDIIDKFHIKDYMIHSEMVDMVSIGNSELICLAIDNDLIEDISDVITLVDALTRKDNYIDDSDKVIKRIIKLLDDLSSSLSWQYYYGRALSNNISIAESILNNNLVTVDTRDYGILTHNILKKNVQKVKDIIEKYDIDIWGVDNISKIAVGSFMYSKECFDFLMSLYDININEKAIKEIVHIHDEVNMIKYLFEKGFFSDEKLNIYSIIKAALLDFKPQVIDYITEERGLIPQGDISELIEISNEIGYEKNSFPKLGF